MWSSMIVPQGHAFIPAKQPKRDFGMLVPSLPREKGFQNPNIINNFNKYQDTVKPVDSFTQNGQNSCHSHHIIDSIKEKCPEVIPSVKADTTSVPEITSTSPIMCLGRFKTKPLKRDRSQRKKRQSNKRSKQNQKTPKINEMDEYEDIQESLSTSTDFCSSPRLHVLDLADFIVPKSYPSKSLPRPSPSKAVSIEIPVKNTDMVLTILKGAPLGTPPNRNRHCSITDSEDSFIIFDHDGNEEHLNEDKDNKESRGRHRTPSLCESEDSFILFEKSDNDSHHDLESDYSLDSSDAESDEEDDWHNGESDCDQTSDPQSDQTDSSFTMVDRKKVRFASSHKLCEIHPMIKWSYAYQAARKGPWEMYARDRCRFKERVYRVERDIKHIFDPQHREKIFKERFENL